jgi:iron(III) transport system substrate-binding protein
MIVAFSAKLFAVRLCCVRLILFAIATAIGTGLFSSQLVFSQELVGKAQEEKKLVLYHSTGIEDTQQIIDLFRKRYPFLLVENHRLNSPKLMQRIVSEVRAGRNLADAYVISGAETWLIKDMGFLAPYVSPERSRIRPSLMDREGYWTGILWNLGVLGYNTHMVTADSVPKRWEDLLQPRWKGLIGLEAEDMTWYIFMLKLMGNQNGKAFMTQLARQQPQVRTGYNLVASLLVAGEFALVPTARVHRVEQAKKEGAPVDWVAIEPLTPEPPVCVSLPKNAAHPNAGKLFIDFILSRPAQELLYQLKRLPSRIDAPQPVPRLAQVKLMTVEFDKEIANFSRYAKEYRDIFGVP